MMIFTGERYHPELGGVIHAEHVHRYRLAQRLAVEQDVLDIACGEGYGSNMLAEVARSVVGVDIASDTVAHAQARYPRGNLQFLEGDCAAIPLADASVDLVVSFETIEHHDRHEQMLREIRRVLRPGGVLLISSPNRPEYDQTLTEPNPFHVKELDQGEFEGLLRAHFHNVALYGQRVLSGLVIAPVHAEVSSFAYFHDEGAQSLLPRPVYFVALASDGRLPALGSSVFELGDGLRVSTAIAVAEGRLYIAEWRGDKYLPYSEARGAACLYAISGNRQTLRLTMPDDLGRLLSVRFDPTNQPVAISLHLLGLEAADGTVLWRWDGQPGSLRNVLGLALRPDVDGLLLVCWNDDPQFEIAIPEEVLAGVGPGAQLVVEMTPRPLLEVLPDLLAEPPQLPAPVTASPGLLAPPIVQEFVSVAQLMRREIERRNATIGEQRAQIEALQARIDALEAHVVRAEAQLDVLKEFVLMAFGQTNERI